MLFSSILYAKRRRVKNYDFLKGLTYIVQWSLYDNLCLPCVDNHNLECILPFVPFPPLDLKPALLYQTQRACLFVFPLAAFLGLSLLCRGLWHHPRLDMSPSIAEVSQISELKKNRHAKVTSVCDRHGCRTNSPALRTRTTWKPPNSCSHHSGGHLWKRLED